MVFAYASAYVNVMSVRISTVHGEKLLAKLHCLQTMCLQSETTKTRSSRAEFCSCSVAALVIVACNNCKIIVKQHSAISWNMQARWEHAVLSISNSQQFLKNTVFPNSSGITTTKYQCVAAGCRFLCATLNVHRNARELASLDKWTWLFSLCCSLGKIRTGSTVFNCLH